MTCITIMACTIFMTCTTIKACAIFITCTTIIACAIFMTCTTIIACAIFMTCTTIILMLKKPLTLVGLWRRCNFDQLNWCDIRGSSPIEDFRCARKAVIYQYLFGRPIITSTFCEADTYQYPLRSRHLPVLFAKPTSTCILCEANTYQYSLQGHHLPIPYSTRWRLA